MSHLIPNSFSSYHLDIEEVTQGSLLTLAQKQLLQNDLALYAERRLALTYDPANPNLFLQQEAEAKGQIGFIQYMLDRSLQTEEAILASNTQPE